MSRYVRQQLFFRKHSLKSAIEWAREDSTRVADSLKKTLANKKIFEKTLSDTLMNLDVKKLTAEEVRSRYHIIIGSFTDPANTQTAAEQFSRQGYKTSIIKSLNRNGDDISLVSIRSFDNPDEARSFLKEFQKTVKPGAWLYSGN